MVIREFSENLSVAKICRFTVYSDYKGVFGLASGKIHGVLMVPFMWVDIGMSVGVYMWC